MEISLQLAACMLIPQICLPAGFIFTQITYFHKNTAFVAKKENQQKQFSSRRLSCVLFPWPLQVTDMLLVPFTPFLPLVHLANLIKIFSFLHFLMYFIHSQWLDPATQIKFWCCPPSLCSSPLKGFFSQFLSALYLEWWEGNSRESFLYI